MPRNIKEDHEEFRRILNNPSIKEKIKDGSIFHTRKQALRTFKVCVYCGASNDCKNESCYMCQSDFELKHKAIKCQVEIYEE